MRQNLLSQLIRELSIKGGDTLLSHQERQAIYNEINQIKGRIGQIKGRIDQIKGEINRNKSEISELKEARRYHERESRRASSGFSYQGGHTDSGISDLYTKNSYLYDEKNALYQELNDLQARKTELYAQLNG